MLSRRDIFNVSVTSFPLHKLCYHNRILHHIRQAKNVLYSLLSFYPVQGLSLVLEAYEVIPFAGITQIERTKDVHLDHIVGMLHGKPSVGSYFSFTL